MNNTIMRNAHDMTRETVKQHPGTDYRATFRAALAIAWSDAKRTSAAWEWAEMDGENQYNALVAMTWAAKKRDDGSEVREYLDWITTPDDARTCAAEAWLEMGKEATKATEQGQPLAIALYRAVMTAGRRIDRQERRNARALHIEDLTTEDGTTYRREYVELNAAPVAELSWSNPESATLTRDEITSAAKDQTDRAIIKLLAIGYTQKEIAQRVGISQPAIAKRLQRMNERRANPAA